MAGFVVTVQMAQRELGVGDIRVFGPFAERSEAETFAELCDTFGLGYQDWDPSYVTCTSISEIEPATVADLARHFDLATEDGDGNPVTDTQGNPVAAHA